MISENELIQKYMQIPTALEQVLRILANHKLTGGKNAIPVSTALNLLEKQGYKRHTANVYLKRLTTDTEDAGFSNSKDFIEQRNGKLIIHEKRIPRIIFISRRFMKSLIMLSLFFIIIAVAAAFFNPIYFLILISPSPFFVLIYWKLLGTLKRTKLFINTS